MPELPEVETVVRGLRSALRGRRIVAVRLGKTDFIEDPGALGERLPGRRIAAVERIGKYIRLALTDEWNADGAQQAQGAVSKNAPRHGRQEHLSLVVHLGMTGRLAVHGSEEPVAPHTHAFFDLDDGRQLRYTDIRRFGRILLLSGEQLEELRGRLGADALDVAAAEFNLRLRGRRARIKALLLDQNVFRGIGNIYADESLWRAGIHPARLAARLTERELARLRQAIQHVLRAAVRLGGSSISDFLDAEGKPGSYQRKHRAYGREGKPCFRCHANIERAVVAGRSSYFCPSCQPPPRSRKAVGGRGRRSCGKI